MQKIYTQTNLRSAREVPKCHFNSQNNVKVIF